MKISFITTVYNEEKTITALLDSIFKQTKMPDEIIIVDGGSIDKTLSRIFNFQFSIFNKNPKTKKIKFIVLEKKGNRAVGRNEAIKNSTGDIIICSDAGCILDKNWIKNITGPFKDKQIDVVAGYYKGKARTIFEKCLIPYVLVMPDRVNQNNFMPASRSMAFKKSIWEKAGGFPENLSHNEDYAFAKKLKKMKVRVVFEKDAIVYWAPRENLKEAFIMFFRFALGDAESGIIRPKVLLIFIRYLLGIVALSIVFIFKLYFILNTLYLIIALYIAWSILKNFKYVNHWKAIIYFPIIQLSSDIAVLSGSIIGKPIFAIGALYCAIVLSVITWGIPNKNHPFLYHMDEWHQLQAIRAIIKHGSSTVAGAAHMPFFHVILTILFVVPFILLRIVNPFIVKNPLDAITEQTKLFIVLRLHTLLLGILSILAFYKILKDYVKINPFVPLIFFTFSPIWLSLSNYYKYDITLSLWIIVSVWMFLRYIRIPNLTNYILASIASALALSTKFSAIPLFFLLMLSFFFYTPLKDKSLRRLFLGVSTYIGVFLLLGVPDLFVSGGNYRDYLFSNLVTVPAETSNYYLFKPYPLFLLLDAYPKLFGHGFYFLFLASFFYWTYILIKSVIKRDAYKYKVEFFIYIALMLFVFSLIPLKIIATGNRVVVLLPFMVLIAAFALRDLYQKTQKKKRKFIHVFTAVIIFLHIAESATWIALKLIPDPREVSSVWIQKNIQKGSTIGIENIPIYQYLPDVILKEYYTHAQNPKANVRYQYIVVNKDTNNLPKFIVVTNKNTEMRYFKKSPKKDLVYRLQKNGYKEKVTFRHNKWYNITQRGLSFYLVSIVPVQDITIYTK